MKNYEAAQLNFKAACQYYNEAKELINELSILIKTAVEKFSFEVAMGQFDMILQGILLRTAVEDGEFLDEEKQFIAKITDYGDIMAIFKDSETKITWDTFLSLPADSLKNISDKFVEVITKLAKSFIEPFAIVDKLLPKDYCKELTTLISAICISLVQCDGDTIDKKNGEIVFTGNSKSEVFVALELVKSIFEDEWKKALN